MEVRDAVNLYGLRIPIWETVYDVANDFTNALHVLARIILAYNILCGMKNLHTSLYDDYLNASQ